MTDAQAYVAFLSKLLAEYGNDPEKCEAIQRRDANEGPGLLSLLLGWHGKDHPDRVTTTTVTQESLSVLVEHRCGLEAGPAQT